MIKGTLTIKFTEEGDQTHCETKVNLQRGTNGIELLYDLTHVVHAVLEAMEVDSDVEAIMLAEAIRRNDWWGSDSLPYNYPDNETAESLYEFTRLLAATDIDIEDILEIAERKYKYKKEKEEKCN